MFHDSMRVVCAPTNSKCIQRLLLRTGLIYVITYDYHDHGNVMIHIIYVQCFQTHVFGNIMSSGLVKIMFALWIWNLPIFTLM